MLYYSEGEEDEYMYEEYEYEYDPDNDSEDEFGKELDYIWELYNHLKDRFPYFHSDIYNFTYLILDTNRCLNKSVKEKDLDKFEDDYYMELNLTFSIINRIYNIDKTSWIKYCYLYNS